MRYVILEPDVIGEFMSGDRTWFVVETPPEAGETIGLKIAPRRKATTLMNVESVFPHPDGGHIVNLRPHTYEDTPRLLHSSHRRPPLWAADEPGQYTHLPVFAMGGSLDPGEAIDIATLHPQWARRATRRHLEALTENATPEERSRRARALARRVRQLALQDPTLTRQIEALVRDAEAEAA